jgi:MbtH protein
MTDEDAHERQVLYKVVVNHEEQYSIWMSHKETPLGWREVGPSRTKEECLSYIEEVWTDMRPLSLRRAMDESNESSATSDS